MQKGGVTVGYLGVVLLVGSVLGFIYDSHPDFLQSRYKVDIALKDILTACRACAIPFGLIGLVLLILGIILCAVDKHRSRKR